MNLVKATRILIARGWEPEQPYFTFAQEFRRGSDTLYISPTNHVWLSGQSDATMVVAPTLDDFIDYAA